MNAPSLNTESREQSPLRRLFPTQRNEWQLLLSIAAGYPKERVGDGSWQAFRLMQRHTSEFRKLQKAEYREKINDEQINALKPGILYDIDVEVAISVEEWRNQLFICSPSLVPETYKVMSFTDLSFSVQSLEEDLRNQAFIRLSRGEEDQPEAQIAEGGAE